MSEEVKYISKIKIEDNNYNIKDDNVREAVGYYEEDILVDLGLPSGTLWAKTNIGADSETDFGLYFAWGETEGYTDASLKAFSWNDYKYGTQNNITKYNNSDGLTLLTNEDDAAYANSNGLLRMPTKEECEELFNYTDNEWTTINGVNGRKFTNKSDSSKYIFIPAAGYCDDGSVISVGYGCCLWSSSRDSSAYSAWDSDCNSNEVDMYADLRCYGLSVRGVGRTLFTKPKSTKEDKSNKVTSLSSSSTDVQYPSAKAVYDSISTKNTTYSALKTLRDNSQLIPGSWYRITDYVTTTVQAHTQSAGHQFDVIVRADEVNKLNENAYAAKHAGDTYFANSKLEAWELKYSLDNDSKFAWANSTSGRGVIYYMKDEWENECPYDFKNIKFLRYKTTSESGAFYHNLYFGVEFQGDLYPKSATIDTSDMKYLYTFTAYTSGYANISDASLNSGSGVTCYKNVIKSCYDEFETFGMGVGYVLNNIVFQGLNTLNCGFNSFGNYCGFNSFWNDCYLNSFGNLCNFNSFGNSCNSNSFGNSCNSNSFGNNCGSNSFGNDCGSNSFGNDCYANSFEGEECYSNSFGNNCYDNTFGKCCDSNSFGNNCTENSFGNKCLSNSFGNSCDNNSFGNLCCFNSFGNYCDFNSFGNGCRFNKFGNSSTLKSNCQYIIVENGNCYLYIDCSATTSSSAYFQNIKVAQGVNNTSTRKTISHNTVNDTFQTIYKPENSVEISV